MDVSIITVNFNTRELTQQCLESIFQQTKDIKFEVIVVDNNSIDGSQQMIKELFPQVLLIENDKNEGFGKANNSGAKKSKGKYLFFLNSDTTLLNNAIKIFFDFAEEHEELRIGAMGTVLLDTNKNITHSSGRFPSKIEVIKSVIIGYLSKKYWYNIRQIELSSYQFIDNFLEVEYVTGADLFISNMLFEIIGGFDNDYFLYYEETDLQIKSNNLNYKNLLINKPAIVHNDGSSSSSSYTTLHKRLIVTKSMFLFFKKHSKRLSYFLFRFIYLIIRLPVIVDTRFPFNERVEYISFLFRRKIV